MTTDITKWADEAMFKSEKHNAAEGPIVHLLHMNADPLAQIAACAKMYKGEVVRSLSDVTHAERVLYLQEMQKTKLAMPLESVTFHFMFENVTRAFTHQLVRQRTAAYAQESMRFAVVEDMSEAVALPPSLAGFNTIQADGRPYGDHIWDKYGNALPGSEAFDRIQDKSVKQYLRWRASVELISDNYNALVNDGMPAEDARGLMPTNIITRVNYITNLRGLLDHAGNRLCTQAQFEWRMVFAQIAKAIREYNPYQHIMDVAQRGGFVDNEEPYQAAQALLMSEMWQFEAIAALLKPVCYQTGRCVMKADFDRKCSIRGRVDENAGIGRPSSEWGEDWHGPDPKSTTGAEGFIGAIHTREWLTDPAAAR